MKISKWPFFCCKNMADNKYRSVNKERRITKKTQGNSELKQIYFGRWDVNERTKRRIPSLPEDYLVSKEAEEILQMVDKTPARLFMMTGDAGTGKTTDVRMLSY